VVVDVLALLGATGDKGEEVVLSSVVVVVELGMEEVSSLAQPTSANRPEAAREARKRFFIVEARWGRIAPRTRTTY